MVLILAPSSPLGQSHKPHRSILILRQNQDAFGLRDGRIHPALIEHRVLTPYHSSVSLMENLVQGFSSIRSHFVLTCGHVKGLAYFSWWERDFHRPVQSCTRWCLLRTGVCLHHEGCLPKEAVQEMANRCANPHQKSFLIWLLLLLLLVEYLGDRSFLLYTHQCQTHQTEA